MSGIILQGLTMDDIANTFRTIVKEEIKASKEAEQSALYISPGKVCSLFDPKISKTTLWNWVNDGKLTKYIIGGKPVYKYSEVIQAVETIGKYKRAS